MPDFSVNQTRFDPYKRHRFRIKWEGRYVAGISKISALRRRSEVVVHRVGGDPANDRKSPGSIAFDPIVLERGVSHDLEFEAWANKVWTFGSPPGVESSLRDFRKDIILELHNEAGQLAIAYNIFRCWPSEIEVLPELDANADGVAIQRMVLQNEGWIRDSAVAEPAEPTLGGA